VDDTPINLKVIQNLLKRTHVQIDVAHSGKECLSLASEKKYHLLLIDHMMPDMDGIETLRHLKNDEASMNKDSVIVAISANAIAGSREFYIGEGFDEYITKPIDPSKLEAMLVKLLPKEIVKLSQ
jgi:CheY-like chemotaxis protein